MSTLEQCFAVCCAYTSFLVARKAFCLTTASGFCCFAPHILLVVTYQWGWRTTKSVGPCSYKCSFMLTREREQNLNSLLDFSSPFFTLSAPLVFHNLLFLDHLQSIRQHNVICEVFARYQVNSLVHTFPHMQTSKQPGGTRGMRVINIQSSVSLLFHLKWRAKHQHHRRKSMSFCSKKNVLYFRSCS